ncbi:hypothetical protein ACHAXA_009650 [Cyclostephanos tholiformis]|uniref:Uncharacterized protein n=1 Tax=Cyclostephanos tholiformis TaxID=382380 RepID=A0ABD3SED9_9STRA
MQLSSYYSANYNPFVAAAAASAAASMTPSIYLTPPYYNSRGGIVGGDSGGDSGNNASLKQHERQGQQLSSSSIIIGPSSSQAAEKPMTTGEYNNDVSPTAGVNYRDAMMATTMMDQREHLKLQLQQQQQQQQQQKPPQSEQGQKHQQVAVVANSDKMSRNDDIFLQIMHEHQQQLQLLQQMQQQQQHNGSATAVAMGYRVSPPLLVGKAGPSGDRQNQHQQLEEQSVLNNSLQLGSRNSSEAEGLLMSSDEVVEGRKGSLDPVIAVIAGGSSLATVNNTPSCGGNGSWHGTSVEENTLVGMPVGFTLPRFQQKHPSIVTGTDFGSMSSSLCNIVGGVANENNATQIPPVVPVEGWRKANVPVKMNDKPQPIVVAAALASTPFSSPERFSRDKYLELTKDSSSTGTVAADAAPAAKPKKIARTASKTMASIACQTSPNMIFLSREKVVVASKSQRSDPLEEKITLATKFPSAYIVSASISRVADDLKAEPQVTVGTVVDSTSTIHLRSILPQRSKKRKRSSPRSNSNLDNAWRCNYIKEISIPSNFSPRHSYRAAAAYSLLRTLSKELRLSPFTLQAFTNALVLPIPSKLLAEVHVRVLRVLFASAWAVHRRGVSGCSNGNMGGYFYEKFGDGGVVDMIARRRRDERNHSNDCKTGSLEKTEKKKEEVEYEFVRKRGGNNLYFLDVFTWPLFYQDYCLMSTEENIMNVMSTTQRGGSNCSVDVDEEFIDVKSIAMSPLHGINLHPNGRTKCTEDRLPSDADNSSGTKCGLDWAHRCPSGPFGRCNQYGRFVCCPFHIRAAVQLCGKVAHSPASVGATSSVGVANVSRQSTMTTLAKKRERTSYPKEKITLKSSVGWMSNVSEESDNVDNGDDNDDDYISPTKKKSKTSSIGGRVRQYHKSQRPQDGGIGETIPILPSDFDARPRHQLSSLSSSPISGIRGIQVSNVEVAARSPDNKLIFVGRGGPRIIPSGPEKEGIGKGVFSDTSNTPAVGDNKNCNAVDPPAINVVRLKLPIIATSSKSHLQSQGAMISPESQEAQPFIPPSVMQLSISQEIVLPSAVIPNPRTQFQCITSDKSGARSVSLPRNPSHQDKIIPSALRPQSVGPSAVPHARSSRPPILVHPVQLRSANSNALVVPNVIVKSIENFFMVGSSKGGHLAKKIGTDCISSDTSFQVRDTASLDDQILAHMIPVQQLERGIPYHHLSLDAKLTMLEFILDELLQVSEISDEMTRRQTLTSNFSSPYGMPPFSHEYEEIFNDDECTVCGVEGDLLCCDGCPGSFHRVCVGMRATAKLPQKWLCPECTIVDASKMGPLGSERRPFVGWFSIEDLESSNQQRKSDYQAEVKKNLSSMTRNLQEQQSPSFHMPQVEDKFQADAITNAAHVDAAHFSPLSPPATVVAVNSSTSATAQTWLQVGRMVFVLPRTWSGINCPGGLGHIEKVHAATTATPGQTVVSTVVTHVDVKYLENEPKTRDRVVPIEYVTDHHHHHLELGTRETSKMSRQHEAPVDHEAEFRNRPIKHSCKLLDGVEFLVTSGNIFARYRSTLEPFDPFSLSVIQSCAGKPQPFAFHKPPLPLNGPQVQELFKLLGPEICLALPWLRIPFDPQKVFADQEMVTDGEVSPLNITQKNLRTLISHQKEKNEFLVHNSERAIEYLNSYRKAPSVPIVKNLFLHPLHDNLEMNKYLYPTSTVPISATILDMTDHLDLDVSIQVFDPIKPIHDNMICLERTLRNACLLDLNWGRSDHDVYDSSFWKKRIKQAKSIRKLSSLLVYMVDNCCLKAFLPHWYNPKESNFRPVEVVGCLSPSTLSEGWSPKQESIRRKWERCQGNDIRRLFQRLFNSLLVDALKSKGHSLNKRGSKRKAEYDSKNVTSSSKIESYGKSASSEEHSTIQHAASKDSLADPVQATDKQISPLTDAATESAITGTSPRPSPNNNFTRGAPYIDKSLDEISENEYGSYAAAGLFKSNKGSKATRDPNAPKKNMSAYFIYQQKMRPSFRSDNPGMSFSQLAKFTSAMYKSLSPEEKVRWEEAALQDKSRYENEMSTYVPPSAITTNQDGTPIAKEEYSIFKKKKLPRRESLASSTSRRRTEEDNILRQEIKVLLGMTDITTSKVESAIVELKVDTLEKLLKDDDTSVVYWPIAGKLAFPFPLLSSI